MDLDDLARASLNQSTPPDERQDLNQELLKGFVKGINYPDMDDVREAVDLILQDQLALAKAVRLEAYSYETNAVRRKDGRGHTSILHINEFGVIEGAGPQSRWVEKPAGGGFPLLRRIVAETDIVKAIILTRQRQILSFCRPERDKSPLGYHLIRRDGEKLTKADQQETQRVEEFLRNCGDEADPRKRKRLRRESMRGFVGKLVMDTLSADACPIETEMTQNGKGLSGFYNVPFDTVRLCTEDGYEGDDEICAVQLYEGVPHVAYTYDDLIYEVRNPRTDLIVNGYGFAETEMILRVVTAYVNSFTYNAAGLDRNSIPRGMLTLFGEYDKRELNAFKSQLFAMLHGAANRWRLPIMAVKGKDGGAEYTPFDTNFNEMFFARWMTLLVSICCAVYSIDPNEIHFDSFSSRNTSPLRGSDTEEKLAHSRDKGLVPLLDFIEGIYNDYLLPLLTTKYKFEFIGLHEEEEKQKWERQKLTLTEDELRDIDGRDPHPDPDIGGAPAGNPALMSLYTQKALAAQQQAMGGMNGNGEDQRGGSGDEDYPRDKQGQHAPYRDENGTPPEGEHFHTLSVGDDTEEKRAPGKPLRKAVPPTDDWMVVLERGVERPAP